MIRFQNVTKQFGDLTALHDISFAVEPGELVMITGTSGSGKTTLMKLLTREYTVDQGEIEFNSQLLSELRSSHIPLHRRQIGVIFQDYRLLEDLNVWENIALALSIVGIPQDQLEQRVSDLLKLVDLADHAYHFPQQLSGGEAQRVSIARALSTAPKLIFADEPTGNLDSETSHRIIQLLKKINELGTTIMLTTHDPEVMQLLKGHHHIHLEKGVLSKDSAPKKDTPAKTETETTAETEPTTTTTATDTKEEAPDQPKTRFSKGVAKIGSLFSKKTPDVESTEPETSPDKPIIKTEDL
jgi:cell division transport system ATP-binding protein